MAHLIDLAGAIYGKWTVICPMPRNGPQLHWLCRCQCGTERSVAGQSLRTGVSTGCGCGPDLAGKTFGKWVVLRPVMNKRGRRQWLCRCECGAENTLEGASLVQGGTKSCGCGAAAAIAASRTVHGMKGTPLYQAWCSMRQRCQTTTHREYRNYGGRGIRVCDEWQDFKVFLRDMGPTWNPGLSIERVDNNGPYAAANCVWIPIQEQPKNRRPFSEWRNANGPPVRSSSPQVD